MKNIIPVILCGGGGERLWPLSRKNLPKPFLTLEGEQTLFAQTIDRALTCSGSAPDRLITVTSESFLDATQQELGAYGPDANKHLLAEPCAKNTAAAVAAAACHAARHFGEDSVLWILPADHYIADAGALREALLHAVKAARNGQLVTFGIKPSRPETGYGYICCKSGYGGVPVLAVEAFIEKPCRETAARFLRDGGYLWNSGMFVFSVREVLTALRTHAPEILGPVEASVTRGYAANKTAPDLSEKIYAQLPAIPFDRAVMEKADNIAVVPCDIGWSDVGTWDSLWELGPKDVNGNVLDGNVACTDSSGCLIRSHSLLIAAAGLRDLTIVEDGDSILIADRRNAAAVKDIVSALHKAGARQAVNPPRERRPWGSFRTLSDNPHAGYKVKELLIRPGQSLSLQIHTHRSEFWSVITGLAAVTIHDEQRILQPQECVFIPQGAPHRIENPGGTDLVIVEVQMGHYLGEDDIIRLEDRYGRTARTCMETGKSAA